MANSSNDTRMGALLVKAGVLNQEQVDHILHVQKQSGKQFGQIAHKAFDVPAQEIWEAYASQMAGLMDQTSITSEKRDHKVMMSLPIKNVWKYRAMPLRMDGDVLVCATTRKDLATALAFAQLHIKPFVQFVLVKEHDLDHFIVQLGRAHKDRLKRKRREKAAKAAGKPVTAETTASLSSEGDDLDDVFDSLRLDSMVA